MMITLVIIFKQINDWGQEKNLSLFEMGGGQFLILAIETSSIQDVMHPSIY